MKKFFKHTNRGLLLSGLVLLIMIIYITVDYVGFNMRKGEIQQVSTDYLSAIFTADVDTSSPGEVRKVYAGILQEYFTSDYNQVFDINQLTLMSVADNNITDSSIMDLSTADFQIQSIDIAKSGTGLATVSIRYRASVTGNPDSLVLTPAGMQPLKNYSDSYYDYGYMSTDDIIDDIIDDTTDDITDDTTDDISEETVFSQDYTFSYDSEITLSLKETQGQWKIASLTSYYYNSNYNVAETE